METEPISAERIEQHSRLHQVTPLSKYLAMTIFIAMPFVGGYVGYQFASQPEPEIRYIQGDDKVEVYTKLADQFGSAYYYKPSDGQVYFFHVIQGEPRTDDAYLKSARVVEDADASSFKMNSGDLFATDDDQVFLYGRAIQNADPKTFKEVDVLGGGPVNPMQFSGVDSQKFYVGHCEFPGVDIETVVGRGMLAFEDVRGQFALVFREESIGDNELYPRSECKNYELVRDQQ